MPFGEETVVRTEEPSEEEEAHSGYDKGAGNGAVEPSCKVESHQCTEEDRVGIADTLEQALNEIPDECIQIDHSHAPQFHMSSSRYGKSLFYKLAFWSEHKADLKEFIQLLR